MLLTTLDTIASYFFKPIRGGTAISSDILMVAIIYFAMSYCYTTDGHIRITFLRDRMNRTLKHATEIISNILITGFWSMIFYQFLLMIIEDFQTGINTVTVGFVVPKIIPNIIISVGVLALILRSLFIVYQLLRTYKDPSSQE